MITWHRHLIVDLCGCTCVLVCGNISVTDALMITWHTNLIVDLCGCTCVLVGGKGVSMITRPFR
jgi:hypothetical protein